ncbi:MAG: protein jag, partial [Desulfomonilaceae bacterium]
DILKEALQTEKSKVEQSTSKSSTLKSPTIQSLPNISVERDLIEPPLKDNEEIDPEKYRIADEAKSILDGILARIPVETTVEASISGDSITLNITGDKSGLLIGKRGQTLDALQFILNKAINKEVSLEDKTEIIVDTEDYRRRKHESLRDMAMKMSLKARRSLKPVAFNPMPANERRIIHLILSEDKEVYTKSYGEGPMRRIIVYPRKAMANKRRRR